MSTTIQIRRDTAANWTSNNPTPALAEFCVSTDLTPVRLKIGDGVSDWASLPYFTLPNATTSEAGLLSATDKVKLNGIEAGAIASGSVIALAGKAIGENVRVTFNVPSAGDVRVMSDDTDMLMCFVNGKGYDTSTIPLEAGLNEVTFVFADPAAIPDDAFKADTTIVALHIPSFVHAIGSNAFADCTSLVQVDSEGMTPPNVQADSFDNVDVGSMTLYVHKVVQAEYTNHAYWGTIATIDTYDNL